MTDKCERIEIDTGALVPRALDQLDELAIELVLVQSRFTRLAIGETGEKGAGERCSHLLDGSTGSVAMPCELAVHCVARMPSTFAPGIASEIVRSVGAVLVNLGVDIDQLASDAPIVEGELADAFFDRAAAQLNEPALGIVIGKSMPIGSFGLLDYALCTASTLRDGLQRVASHYGLVTQRVSLELVEDTDKKTAAMQFTRVPGLTHSRHWLEFAAALIATRMRETVGAEIAFTNVSFIHPAPSDRKTHDEVFATTVQFGAPSDRVEFDASVLDLPLRTASAALAGLLELKMQELAPARDAAPLLARVHHALGAMLDERQTDVEGLAKRLGMSKRSLQRALGELGTSHSALLDQLRRERAIMLLGAGHRVTDVASALGFAAPSAFFRAYRRWTGTSPKGS
jgi:AraC-like DNA-binding protein